MKLFFFLILCMFVFNTGCSTTQTKNSDTKPLPSDRLLAFQNKAKNITSTLTVIRDEGFRGSACYIAFYIDHILAARFDVAETADFFIEPGARTLTLGNDPQGKGLCGINWSQQDFIKTVITNDHRCLRLSLEFGRFVIQECAPEVHSIENLK